MAKTGKRNETAIEKVDGSEPNFLAKYVDQDTSLDALKGYRVVPRLKVIQPTTSDDLRSTFGLGSVVIRPGDVLVCRANEDPKVFSFVPLFFFAEFCKWRDLKQAGQGSNVLERSFDPTSIVAKKSRNSKTRFELYEGHENRPEREQCKYRYVEHLRFIGVIYGEHELTGVPVTLSFERGEYGQGTNFISAISLRRMRVDNVPKPMPLWSQVWDFSMIYHNPDPMKKWYGFKFEPAEPSTIEEGDAEFMFGQHKELKELYEKQRLLVDDDDVPDEETTDPGSVKGHSEF